MKRIGLFLGSAALALSSSLALAEGPEDLLPPAFRDPPSRSTPTPTPVPTPTGARTAPSNTGNAAAGGTVSAPVVQSLPGDLLRPSNPVALPEDFPSLAELEEMDSSEINDLLGLRPKFDIPAAARRAVSEVGILSRAEGGFPARSLVAQPAALVRAALVASEGPLVSRWGHILMRRVLASRLDAPEAMDPVEFAALRARALGAMGEGAVARALVQDVDGSNYDRALTDAAFNAYVATGDILGMCPVARLRGNIREDSEWELLQAICSAYLGEFRSAERSLDRAYGTGVAPEIDVRLAQRFAGAAGNGSRAVNIEWDGVDELTPWRFALARALGVELPEGLRDIANRQPYYGISEVLIPASPLLQRVDSADLAGQRGVLSSAAMVDLYSQLWASDAYSAGEKGNAALLREAYVAVDPDDRISAMRQLWEGNASYGRQVLTAYAAARVTPSEELGEDAASLIASMLTAGLDQNAMRWEPVVATGSEAWALLVLAQPAMSDAVSENAVDSFVDDDDSAEQRKSAFLVAGLAGLGRLDSADFRSFADRLDVDYTRSSPWSEKIARAAQYRNSALVALLAGLGMQGTSWEQMTPRQLYHIVSALDRVGLSAEARMIAAEAVARG